MKSNVSPKSAWTVLFAGLTVNLTLGVLYSWSVIKKALVFEWGWTNSNASLPYSVAIVVWAITLLFAGRLQDTIGPRKVITFGAIFTGLGLLLSGFVHDVTLLTVTFGILSGGGIGFAYASCTPAALKWFHSSKKGMVSGIVVSGMGLASLYIAPLTTMLLNNYGISKTFIILGIFILIVGTAVSQLIKNPPEGYVPPAPKNIAASAVSNAVATVKDLSRKEVLKTKQFYLFWLMFAFASSAGLLIIGNIATIAKTQANWDNGFYLVALLAIFNTSGRLAAGFLSDRIGRVRTMSLVFLLQGVNMALFSTYTNPSSMAIGTALAGIGYGALFSLFPSVTADYYGVKNLGANYGILYTAWGISGVMGPIIAGIVVDKTGTYDLAYVISAVLLAIALITSFLTKPLQSNKENPVQLAHPSSK